MINQKLIEIHDVYFISELIKNINSNFKLYFNPAFNRYEIHNTINKPSFVISLSNYPSQEAIIKLIKTNKNNMASLFKEIEESNRQLEENKQNQLIDKAQCELREIVNYANKNPSKSPSNLSFKNILEKED